MSNMITVNFEENIAQQEADRLIRQEVLTFDNANLQMVIYSLNTENE